MIYVAVMGFNNPKVINGTFERFENLTDYTGLNLVKIFYDCHYPLPNKVDNKVEYKKACEKYGWEYRALEKNFGQDGNINKIFEDLKLEDQDLLLFWDPDNYPAKNTYLKNLVTHISAHPEVGYCTLWREHPEFDMRGTQGVLIEEVPRFRYIIGGPGGWPMAIWRAEFMKKAGGLHQTHSYYGGTEGNILMALRRAGMCGTMLEDEQDLMICVDNDQFYIAWKHIVINHLVHPDFEEWLQQFKMIEITERGKNLT